MKNKLLFATHNHHKYGEVKDLIPAAYTLLSMHDTPNTGALAENGITLEENALSKIRQARSFWQGDLFADDTGLEVPFLNGRPGVHSARYAGPENKPEDNIRKLLSEMASDPIRKARFRTVIALFFRGKEYLFEGIVNGKILTEKRGSSGFGYDPVFQPEGYDQTFAEMELKQKNLISHRALAFLKLVDFLEERANKQ